MVDKKYVYSFGGGDSEGSGSMKDLLGGKGANLAEMASLGLPVPPGFTITTECCVDYFKEGSRLPEGLDRQVEAALRKVEQVMGMKFGDPANPLLVSCRSGARSSMPGMMETVLNVGLATSTIPGLIAKTGNERFVYDAYRRLIMMYSDVVMEKAEGIEPEEGKAIRKQLDEMLDRLKESKGYASDTDLTVEDLKQLCEAFKRKVRETLGKEFPDDPMQQLRGGICAVLKSWNGKKAVSYRRIEGIPDEWGTAVNVQSMVFGNMGDTSATGVAFTRNPATGENKFYGEWLVNAQGEDVVAGTRTPNPLNADTCNEQNKHLKSLEELYPALYKQLFDIRNKLEAHYRDMLDIEFTIQEGVLYMLQCRVGKRTGTAALNMAMDMLDEKMIDEKTAVLRVSPAQLDRVQQLVELGPARRAAAPDPRPEGRKMCSAHRKGAAGRSGRGGRTHRLLKRRGGRRRREGRSGGHGPRRDESGGCRRHARRDRHPDRARRHDQPRGSGLPRLGQMLHRRRGFACDRRGEGNAEGRRENLHFGRCDQPERHARICLRRTAGDDRFERESAVETLYGAGGQVPPARCPRQRRHAGRRADRAQFRRGGHRPLPHRTHVLRQKQ